MFLFVCVFIHELTHSITSQKNKIHVERIVLLPIGGISVIEPKKMDPKVEFNVAISGPIMSILLAFIFGAIATLLGPGIIQKFVQEFFILNLLLGVFNIIPAFPLDGGRALRSWLSERNDEYVATKKAITVSKYLIYLFVIGSVGFVLFANNYSIVSKEFIFMWNLIIVFFLYSGMKSEESFMEIKKNTEGMNVGVASNKHFLFVPHIEKRSWKYVYMKVKRSKEHTLIFSKKDEFYLLDLRRSASKDMRASAVRIPAIDYDTNIAQALSMLESSDYGIAVVKKGKEPIGIVTAQHLRTLITLHMMAKKKRKSINN
ncbi:MAG: site-2 protease family protein [Candidatus Micrarchaeaceae archaeon]